MALTPILKPLHMPINEVIIRPMPSVAHCPVPENKAHKEDVVYGRLQAQDSVLSFCETADGVIAIQEPSDLAFPLSFSIRARVHPVRGTTEHSDVQGPPASAGAVEVKDHRPGLGGIANISTMEVTVANPVLGCCR